MKWVDSHHHFWDPSRRDYYWMDAEILSPIRVSKSPEDLRPLINRVGIAHTVIVQTIPSLDETREFLQTAADTDFVAGVVGWADLTDPDIDIVLANLKSGPGGKYLVGIRHQIHDEENPDWAARPDVINGVAAVGRAGLVYDLLTRERELPASLKLVAANPQVTFVMDHISKPRIAEGEMQPWQDLMTELAGFNNVWCKISGMVTEADWKNWTVEDLEPYVAHVIKSFGTDRLLFGSDWPVCNLAGDYRSVFSSAETLVRKLAPEAFDKVFAQNAVRLYGLKV
ncbi:MAG: amidohydrolase family protein [Rhizobiaceae bacterium]